MQGIFAAVSRGATDAGEGGRCAAAAIFHIFENFFDMMFWHA